MATHGHWRERFARFEGALCRALTALASVMAASNCAIGRARTPFGECVRFVGGVIAVVYRSAQGAMSMHTGLDGSCRTNFGFWHYNCIR